VEKDKMKKLLREYLDTLWNRLDGKNRKGVYIGEENIDINTAKDVCDKNVITESSNFSFSSNAENILTEYTPEEKTKIGIPLDAIARGKHWYVGDTYVGKVVVTNGEKKFVGASLGRKSRARDLSTLPKKQNEAARNQAAVLRELYGNTPGAMGNVAREFIVVLERGNKQSIADFIKKYKIQMSSTGRIRATFPGQGYKYLVGHPGGGKNFRGKTKEQHDQIIVNLKAFLTSIGLPLEELTQPSGKFFTPISLLRLENPIIPKITEEPPGSGNYTKIEYNYTDTPEVDFEVETFPIDDSSIAEQVELVLAQERVVRALAGNPEKMEEMRNRLSSHIRTTRVAHNLQVSDLIKCEQRRAVLIDKRKKEAAERGKSAEIPDACIRPVRQGSGGILEIADGLQRKVAELGLTSVDGVIAGFKDLVDLVKRRENLVPPDTKSRIDEEFNERLKKIILEIGNSQLESAAPYLMESIAACFLLRAGQRVAFPVTGFPLADLLTHSYNHLVGGNVLRGMLVSVGLDIRGPDWEEESVEPMPGSYSVKRGKGAASSCWGKIREGMASFSSRIVKNSDGTETQLSPQKTMETLLEQGSKSSETSLFQVPTDCSSPTGAKKTSPTISTKCKELGVEQIDENLSNIETDLLKTMRDYETDIREYYGFGPSEPSLEEIARMLKNGSRLVCGPDGVPVEGPPRKRLGDVSDNPLNTRQWQLSYLNGYIFEAIHNRTVDTQSYIALMVSTEGGVETTNGRTVLSAVSFEPEKALEDNPRVGPDGKRFLRPDGGLVGHTVPIDREAIKTGGNPCLRSGRSMVEDILANEILSNIIKY
jgi:hypothetical protein